jgi:predicted nucleic acid-binding protein
VNRKTAFWDSSAIVPLCIHEAASRFAWQQLRRNAPVVWWGSSVEVHSAICRLHRSNQINDKEQQGALARLQLFKDTWGEILPSDDLRDLAEQLLGRYVLRAADSIQLAAALTWCGQYPANKPFLSGDRRLSEAAASGGFDVIDLPLTVPQRTRGIVGRPCLEG